MGEIETVEAEKMGWLDLPRGTSYPTFPYIFCRVIGAHALKAECTPTYLGVPESNASFYLTQESSKIER